MKVFGKLLFILAVSLFMFTSCPQSQDGGGVVESKVMLYFSVEDNVGGSLLATVNGEVIQTKKELKKGDEVIFTASPDKEYFIEKWTQKKEGESEEVVNGDALVYKLVIEKTTVVKVKFINEKDLPSLKLAYLSINGNEVKDLEASELSLAVSTDNQGNIYARDIVTKFTYGNETTPQKMKSWIKDGTKILQSIEIEDDGSTILNLTVPGKKGRWQNWKGKVRLKKRIFVDFKINNVNKIISPQVENKEGNFVSIESQKFDVEGNFLDLAILNSEKAIKKIVVNGQDLASKIKAYDEGSKLTQTLALQNMTEGDDISVVVTPVEDTLAENHFTFKVKGNSNVQAKKIEARLAISGDNELPINTFLNKLTESSPPTWKVKETSADIDITVDDYTHDFLLDKIEINGDVQTITESVGWFGGANYKVKKKIENLTTSDTLVTIKFTSKDETKAPSLEWKFNLQSGGMLPPLPQGRIGVFTINNEGKVSAAENSFKDEFLNHLNDESEPVYIFDGNTEGKLEIRLGCYGTGLAGKFAIKEVNCSFDGGTQETVTKVDGTEGQLKLRIFTCEKTFSDDAEHSVKIEVVPEEATKYSNLTLKFKVKNSGKKPSIPNVRYYVDRGFPKANGYKASEPMDGELSELSINLYEDVLEKVEIGPEDALISCEIYKSYSGKIGKYIYATEHNVLLPTDGTYKKYIIRLHPNAANKDKYRITDFECYLTGKKVREDNAEFYYPNKNPYVYHEKAVSWKNEVAGTVREYGLKTVQLNAITVSPRAKVKYRIVGLNGQTIKMKGDESAQIKEMQTDSLGRHWADLSFYDEKPTTVEIYVVAENGETDDNFGKWSRTYNNIPLYWSETEPEQATDLKTYAYDEIKVDKSKLKNNKLYIAFGLNNDLASYEYKPSVNNEYQNYQTKPEKLEDDGDWTWYKTQIDVSSLTKDNSLEAVIPILTKSELCFTYKVRLTL